MQTKMETKMETINFEELIGHKASLYTCNELNKFQLGSVIFEVIEDENDGYRSCMKEVVISEKNANKRFLLAEVVIKNITTSELTKNDYNFDGFCLKDTLDGHVWLEFGTKNSDDWYPFFVFSWNPKESTESKELKELKNLIK